MAYISVYIRRVQCVLYVLPAYYLYCMQIMHFTELLSENQQCPFLSIVRKELSCYQSVFPEEFYKESTFKICQ